MDSFLSDFMETAGTKRVSVIGTKLGIGHSTTHRQLSRIPNEGPDGFVISWFLSGDGEFSENGKEYSLGPMSVVLRRPDREWKLTVGETQSVRIYLDIPMELYFGLCFLIPELGNLSPVLNVTYRKELIEEYLLLSEKTASLNASELYTVLPRFISFILNLTGISELRANSPMHAAARMLEDVSDQSSLEEISEKCGMNYNTFRKAFADSYGIAPGAYRNSCRMDFAKSALLSGQSIASVAELCGFPDVYSFTRRFSETVGISPAKYKKGNLV